MNKREQETLLLTIRANLERKEDGTIRPEFTPMGKYEIIEDDPKSSLTNYFTSSKAIGIDQWGQIENE